VVYESGALTSFVNVKDKLCYVNVFCGEGMKGVNMDSI
jgi:hypothetical protein